MDTRTLLLCSGLLAVILLIKCESNIIVQRFICAVHDNSTVQDVNCFSKPVNRSLRLMTAELFLARPVSNITINGILYKKTVVRYKPFLVNVTENLCEFLGKNRGGIYIRAVTRLVLPYSNMNHPCPYDGPIYFRNMPLEMDSFLSIWPAGEYRLDILFSDETKLVIVVQVFIEIK